MQQDGASEASRGIYQLLEDVDEILRRKPVPIYLAWSSIFRVIHLIKTGFHAIPELTRQDMIDRLDVVIKNTNACVPKSQRLLGHIINIHPYAETYCFSDISLLWWECNQCSAAWRDTHCVTGDLISPHTCVLCGGVDIIEGAKPTQSKFRKPQKTLFQRLTSVLHKNK